MKKSWGLIPKILSGEKTIESRWYQTRRTPWDRIRIGDMVYFKNSGEAIVAQAVVSEVLQFEVYGLTDAVRIVEKYGKEIALVNDDPKTWGRLPKYCILVRLQNPMRVDAPFEINKEGFGTGAAWITVGDIRQICL
ncbi:MAG: hypothetical protein Q8P88_00050 [Candidatus Jorgensenbacteria bacterium]|nr:hypothetical protein [Candidatus Jorgensenbacteria bacterium]